MPPPRHLDDILNINVGGKKYTVRRSDLMADPRSKLADWFRPNSNRPQPTDKAGNLFLDRDAKAFRHILAYLRLKKERLAPSLALPSKPDELAKLVAECEALNLAELKDYAFEMLQKYQRTDEQHYVTSYVQFAVRDYESWQYDRDQASVRSKAFQEDLQNGQRIRPLSPAKSDYISQAYDEWDNLP